MAISFVNGVYLVLDEVCLGGILQIPSTRLAVYEWTKDVKHVLP